MSEVHITAIFSVVFAASIQTEMAAFAIKYEEERKSHEVLKDRFNTLDRNHVEMIKLKDEYKAGNEILRYDNERLKSDNENLFSESISEKDKVIAKLNDDLQKLQSKLDKAEEKERFVNVYSRCTVTDGPDNCRDKRIFTAYIER